MSATVTPLADWIIVLPLLLCLGGGAALLILRTFVRLHSWLCLGLVALVLAADIILFGRVLTDGPVTMTMGNWLPPFGISFTVDIAGAGFALAAAFSTLCILLYMQGDTPDAAIRDGVYPLTLLLLAGVTGSFLTGDLFNLYVWFEVMLISGLGLMVVAGRPLHLEAALKYGLVSLLGTALFLVGLGLLYGLVGTLNMADLVSAVAAADPASAVPIAALLAVAFGVKAAMVPLNGWLAGSYHAPPAAISALLAAMPTKVAAFALLRVMLTLMPGAREFLAPALMVVAMATAILGPLSAIGETSLRRAVGFLLIGSVALIVLCTFSPSPGAVAGSLAYAFHSILTFAAIYMVAGLVERATGATRIDDMRGLYEANSLLSILFLVLVIAAAGLPPFLGFWPKLMLLQGFVPAGEWLAVVVVLLNALLTLIAGTRLWSFIFWRGTAEKAPLPFLPLTATSLLTAAIVFLGVAPQIVISSAEIAASDMLAPQRYIDSVGLTP